MHRTLLSAVLIATAATLGGCVINISDEDARGWNHESKELRNRDYISHLALGTPMQSVRGTLGEPDFSEAWLEQGEEVRVLRYRTHRTHADGDTTIDETTPLVFKAGKLVGIGERLATERG